MLLANLISGIASTLLELKVLLARAQSINFEGITINLESLESNLPDIGFSRTFADLPPNVRVISAMLLYEGVYGDEPEIPYYDRIKFITISSNVDYTRVYIYFQGAMEISPVFRIEIKYITIN